MASIRYFSNFAVDEMKDNEELNNNILDKILTENTEKYYLEAKKELDFKEDSLAEYKIALFKSQLDAKEKEYKEVLSENEKLKKELEAEKSFNDEIKNSKSWKLMNMYRKIRG